MCDRPFSLRYAAILLASLCLALTACSTKPNPQTVTMLIENSPTSLDPRIGIDAQSEHIGSLIFDALVKQDDHFNLQPWLATRWETPDSRTYVFHLRSDVYFQNGKLLDAGDVKWTLDSMRNGTVLTAKGSSLDKIESIEAPDSSTVILHLKEPDAALLWNLSDGALGIVPAGSGRDFGIHPIGTGPFRFVSQRPDNDVVLERNEHSWRPLPAIRRLRFSVVPDAITRALELEKGSADVCINCLTADMVAALANRSNLKIDSGPGTNVNYLAFNTQDPVLKDARVRQAIAFAINRPLIIQTIWRGSARLANSVLPQEHWAWSNNPSYWYDPARANAILDQGGWKRGGDGIRFHLTIKTSTDETARLLALVLQQELRQVGIALDVRSFEFATLFADVNRGTFQMFTLRWLGAADPDIYRYAFSTSGFPPHGANRGRYTNAELDALVREAGMSSDHEQRRRDYARVQAILASDLPAINLWYLDTVMVHSRRLANIQLPSSGNFDFLKTATVAGQ